jgi:hypothetical protein
MQVVRRKSAFFFAYTCFIQDATPVADWKNLDA